HPSYLRTLLPSKTKPCRVRPLVCTRTRVHGCDENGPKGRSVRAVVFCDAGSAGSRGMVEGGPVGSQSAPQVVCEACTAEQAAQCPKRSGNDGVSKRRSKHE